MWTVARLRHQRSEHQTVLNQLEALHTELAELRRTHHDLELKEAQTHARLTQLDTLEKRLEDLQRNESHHLSEISRLKSELALNEKHFQEKLALLEDAKQVLSREFKLLSSEIIDEKQKQLSEHSKVTMNALIEPMQNSFKEFKETFQKVHESDITGRASLMEQLTQLQSLNRQMSEETQNLTSALKGDQKLQGNWGELILEKMLEKSGLRKGIEFEREAVVETAEGRRSRPDVIIHLPDDKQIIVDSKVSLVHYEQAMNVEEPREKSDATKAHLKSLQAHIKSLAEKRYDHLPGLNAPDFVLMFIPVEGAYLMAVEQSPELFENAFDRRVAVVTPTTLFTTLKTVEHLWRYERQSEHTLQLIQRAAEVHDKFVGFVENFEKVGKQLQTAQQTYDGAWKQLINGRGNLVRQAEMLKDLAGKTRKELPQHLLQEAEGSKLVESELNERQ